MLSWFDERPEHLARLIASLPIAGVTHLVALDGRYELLACDYDQSPQEQVDAIRTACTAAGIGLTLEQPDGPFTGNEIEKRTRLFQLAETVTTTDDIYFVMDADESVLSAPADLHDRLANATEDCGETIYIHHGGGELYLRKIFRAIRGLHVAHNHFTYVTPDGRWLWGRNRDGQLEPHMPDLDIEITHHLSERHPMRDLRKMRYYRDRDKQRIEN